jgi:hypothetical protein
MTENNVIEILDLLKRLNDQRIKISLEGDGLSLVYRKGQKIKQDILNEIKKYKHYLIEYLKGVDQKGFTGIHEIKMPISKFEYKGEIYYEITPVQIYWVNNEMDQEYKLHDRVHGSVILNYEIEGNFKLNIFNKAISFLLARHECLRATFHKIKDKYLIRIEKEESCF